MGTIVLNCFSKKKMGLAVFLQLHVAQECSEFTDELVCVSSPRQPGNQPPSGWLASTDRQPPKTSFASQEWGVGSHNLLPVRFYPHIWTRKGTEEVPSSFQGCWPARHFLMSYQRGSKNPFPWLSQCLPYFGSFVLSGSPPTGTWQRPLTTRQGSK